MLKLELLFLGPMRAHYEGVEGVKDVGSLAFRTDKIRALLAYLALEPRPHRREVLAGLLWPDHAEQAALTNLRISLYRLRQTLAAAAPEGQALLIINRQTVALAPGHFVTDVQQFEDLLAACQSHAHLNGKRASCDECRQRLVKAATLYKDDLLIGIDLKDSDPFEEWLLVRREGLCQKLQDVLGSLANTYAALDRSSNDSDRGRAGHEDTSEALAYARRLLTIDPLREDMHRLIMQIHANHGRMNAMTAQYEACQRILQKELGVHPDAETSTLYESLRRTQQPPSVAPPLAIPALATGLPTRPRHEWGEMPSADSFQGRSAEMAHLQRLLQRDQCRMVSILGIGGIGKTTLAAALVKTVAADFDVVIWRSLLNSPPVDEILRDWLQILSQHTLSRLPESLDERIRLLLALLQQQRCLLVLDNLESILQPSQPNEPRVGEARVGYEGYATLMASIANREHPSCLLVTSRELPSALMRIGRGSTKVQQVSLAGLDPHTGVAILERNGLSASSQEAEWLVRTYSGNPLALQIVATTIADFFGGNIGSFQREQGVQFEGIRDVLHQQFRRLSLLERDVVIWMAIEREPVTLQRLSGNLTPIMSLSQVLNALNALRARSLLERVDDGLALQNVVMEYMTDQLVATICDEIITFARSSAITETAVGKLSWLHRYPLLNAQAKDYLRQSQERLILQPVLDQLMQTFDQATLQRHLSRILAAMRAQATLPDAEAAALYRRSYAGGNILNMLLQLQIDVTGCDFSHLPVRQAYLAGQTSLAVNFAHSDLSGSKFANPFSAVWAVAYSPDGQWIAGGSLDGAIYLWDSASGATSAVYRWHQGLVFAVAFSPDGKLLASTSDDGKICVWHIKNNALLRVFDEHASVAYSVAFSPDSRWLASASDSQRVHLWDVNTGTLIRVLDGHTGRVVQVAFSADGHWLASCSTDQTVRVWDLRTSSTAWILKIEGYRVEALAFSPQLFNGHTLLASGSADSLVRLWDIQTGENFATLAGHEDFITSLAFSVDGSVLASGSGDQTVRLWHVDTLQSLRVMQTQGGRVWSVSISPDGKSLVSGNWDQTVQVWDIESGKSIREFCGFGVAVSTLASTRDGRLLAGTMSKNHIRLWDGDTGKQRHTLQSHTKPVRTIALSQDGDTLVSAGLDHLVRTWSTRTGKMIECFEGHTQRIESVAISQTGQWIASSGLDKFIYVWDCAHAAHAKRHLRFQKPESILWSLALSPDLRFLASGGEAFVCVWSLETKQLLYRGAAHHPICQTLAFSPDSNLLASGGHDQTIFVWDASTGRLHRTLQGHRGTIEAVAFSQDQQQLVSAAADNCLCVWDIESGKCVRQLTGHTNWPLAVAFRANGQGLISGSSDGVIKFWDLQTGNCIQSLQAMGPYDGMNITGATGISDAQRSALVQLGAFDGAQGQSHPAP